MDLAVTDQRMGNGERHVRDGQPEGVPAERHRLPVRVARPGHSGQRTFAILPASFRPSHNLYITVYTNGDTTGTVYIAHSGVMEAFSGTGCGSGNTAQCFTSLATLSFPINS